MDTRLYHYEYRRPRHSNPTYSSYNVNNSMTFFMGSPNNHNASSSYDQHFRPANFSKDQYSQRSQAYLDSGNSDRYRQRARSHLSNYGTSSLAFNQRDIFDKQNSKFNIISLKPKEVQDKIKVYPKFTLEDKDAFYYQKMKKSREQELATEMMRNSSMSNKQSQGAEVAGKHTFVPEQGKNPNYYQHGRYFTPRMLNHADEVGHVL